MTLLGSRFTYFGLIGLGAVIGAVFVYMDNEDRTIRDTYKPTPCTIESAEVSVEEHVTRGRWNSRHVRRTYYADIVYTYRVNGEEHEGDVYRAFEQGMSEAEADAVVNRYAEGQSATCYVNPADPEDAVLTLDSDRSMMYTAAAFGLFFLFTGIAGWVVIDFVLPKADKGRKAREEELSAHFANWTPARTSSHP
jgi:hypothetical protein